MRLRILLAGLLASCSPSDGEDATSSGSGGHAGCHAGETPLDNGCLAAGFQPNGCAAGETWFEGLGCLPAGTPANGCAAGELPLDGACVPAGVPADGCALGFVHDGDGGCTAVLPAEPCAPGTIALPGETSCRALAPCGSGLWGDIPTNGTMVYVDAGANGGGDGSASKPFRTIQAAIDAAPAGATLAIAAASYAEALVLAGKPLSLWGVCPQAVEALGLDIGPGADGSEVREIGFAGGVTVAGASQVLLDAVWIHDTAGWGFSAYDLAPRTANLTIRGSLVEAATEYGLIIAGAADVLIEDVVVRDTLPTPSGHGWGITVQIDETTLADASATVRNTIVERNAEVGVMVHGAAAHLEGVLIRNTQPNASNRFGRGFVIQTVASLHPPSDVSAEGIVIEGARDAGILVAASRARIERCVVRDVLTNLDNDDRGNGIGAQPDPVTSVRPTLEVRHCLVERASENGFFLGATDARLEGVLVRDIQPIADGNFGRGISAQYGPGSDPVSKVEIRGSRVQTTRDAGIFVVGSETIVDTTLITDTRVRASDGDFGIGIVAQNDTTRGTGADLTITSSIVDRSHGHGIFATGAHAHIAHTLVRDVDPALGANSGRGINIQGDDGYGVAASATLSGVVIERAHEIGLMIGAADVTADAVLVRDILPPASQFAGRGVNVQHSPYSQTRSSVTLRWSHIERVHDVGIFVANSDMVVEATAIRDVKPQALDGLFGDGLVVTNLGSGSAVDLSGVLIEHVARAGVAVFGSQASLAGTRLACNPLDLVGNALGGAEVELENRGGNACGCEEEGDCKVLSPSIEPPASVP